MIRWYVGYKIRNLFKLKWKWEEERKMVNEYRCIYIRSPSILTGRYDYRGIYVYQMWKGCIQ